MVRAPSPPQSKPIEGPCQKTFRCRSRHHEGARATPYCFGGDGESCNACWYTEMERREAMQAKVVVIYLEMSHLEASK